MHLERAKKESPRCAGHSPRHQIFSREERDDHGGGQNKDDCEEEGNLLDHGFGILMEFVECVYCAPEVGDFVLEDPAGEGEDAVNGLNELQEWWIVPGFAVNGDGERSEQRWTSPLNDFGRWGISLVVIIQCSDEERNKDGCKS